ncbi:pyroglutamylated RF-amide peptide receptor-like [Acropora millepora]|uniref:pyroglutamylated RF-amide peptide receptor-like n=1 Tax=Acropora millepora TaxID=45264 RepID=UPI001CF4180D|nr:pyroglutamylated RF-amide peptide receptor-like [Acropora millepora]
MILKSRIAFFLRRSIDFLLANMAAADITYSIFHLSELIFQHISNKPEGMSGPGFCFLRNPGIQWIGASCSALTLVVVAFERYLVVRNPHGNQKVSTEKLKVIIPCCWICSTILLIPNFFILNYEPHTNTCSPLKMWIYHVGIVSWSIVCLSSSILMAGLYSKVVYTLWFEQSEVNVLPPEQQVVLKVRKRVTLMVLTVTIIFAICWSADAILHLLERFYFHKNLPLVHGIIHTMLAFKAAPNPFEYALINQRFRAKITEILSSSVCSRTERVHSLRQRKSYDINMANEIHAIENRKQAHAGVVGTSAHQTSRQTRKRNQAVALEKFI